jgi:hypothetical protein
MCSCGSGHLCVVCKIVGAILGIVVILATIAAVIGVWMAHNIDGVWTFGTLEGSWSIVALLLGVLLVKKCMKMCPCRHKGGCGCMPGKDMGMGMCPGCGKSPCMCGK